MKFLLIVWVIRLVVGALIHKGKKVNSNEEGVRNDKVFHPAEFGLR
jgi:hypothetical protein